MSETHETNGPRHEDVRRERTDASPRSVLWFGAGLVAVAVFIHVLLWFLMNRWKADEQTSQPELPAVAKELPHFPQDLERVPAPRQHVTDAFELEKLRNHEKALLDDPPSWVDREKKIARIPIADAMKLMVERTKKAEAKAKEGKK